MENTDLRIGNLAQDRNGKVLIVIGVGKGECTRFESKNGMFAHPVSPIPLTEDWLIKAGFFKGKDDFFGTEAIFTQVICIYAHGENVFSLYRYNDAHVYIKYVHQLQNLYKALTGEELTFDV